MEIIPSLSFKQEIPVLVKNGRYHPLLEDTPYNTINEIMDPLADHDKLYLFDIDAIETNRIQSEVIRRLGARKELWADIGSRDLDTIIDAYVIGAERVVISTMRMPSLDLLEDAVELSDRLVFTINHKDGIISPDQAIRSLEVKDLVKKALNIGVETMVILDLSENSFDTNLIEYLPDGDYKLFIGGNVERDNVQPTDIDGFVLSFKEVLEWKKD